MRSVVYAEEETLKNPVMDVTPLSGPVQASEKLLGGSGKVQEHAEFKDESDESWLERAPTAIKEELIPMPRFTGISHLKVRATEGVPEAKVTQSDDGQTLKLEGMTHAQLVEIVTILAQKDGILSETQGIMERIEDLIALSPLEVVGDAEVFSVDEPEYITIEIALDSGAGDHVISRVDLPGAMIRESSGSKAGQHFLAAGGQRLANEGEMPLTLTDETTKVEVDSVFQVCEVTRPLWSVGKVCDRGYKALFDSEKAVIFKQDPNVPLCTFERKGGLYIGRLRVKNPRHEGGFARQGR